jgi:hypothetical protein
MCFLGPRGTRRDRDEARSRSIEWNGRLLSTRPATGWKYAHWVTSRENLGGRFKLRCNPDAQDSTNWTRRVCSWTLLYSSPMLATHSPCPSSFCDKVHTIEFEYEGTIHLLEMSCCPFSLLLMAQSWFDSCVLPGNFSEHHADHENLFNKFISEL